MTTGVQIRLTANRPITTHARFMQISVFLSFSILVSASFTPAYAQHKFPLKVSDNQRHLVDANQKPFPILGRTAWFIISQPVAGYQHFIDNTIQYGYNAVEMAAITHWPMGNHAPFNGEGEAPFVNRLNGEKWDGVLKYQNKDEAPDLLSPNEKYWRYLDQFLAYCESKNLMVFMFPAYLGYEGKEQGWMQELVANGNEKTKAYGAWIADRYKNRTNIVWMLLGDMGVFDEPQRAAEEALITGLKSVKGQQSILYTAESFSGENAAENKHFGKDMTINGVYTWELKNPVPRQARRAYANQPVMPAFLLEEPYDEEGPDGNKYNPNATQPVRRFQWWGWLGTIGGYISGNGYVWQFVDPVWQQHLDTQGAKDMHRLNKFIGSIEWWKLVPSGLDGTSNFVVNSVADTSAAYISVAASRDGNLLVAYAPPAHKGNMTIDATTLKQNLQAWWFDPTNGKYLSTKGNVGSKKNELTFTHPSRNSTNENDWVLLLTDKPQHP